MSRGNVIVADDDAAIRTVINQALGRAGFDVRVTSNAATLYSWVAEGQGDVVVSDVVMPDGDGIELLEKIKRVRPELPVIVMSAQNTFVTALRASNAEAFDYLPKPFDLDQLVNLIAHALDQPRDNRTALRVEQYQKDMPLVGRSSAMQDIYRTVARLMHHDAPVLITGEYGTGKQLISDIIHRFGARHSNPYVSVNLSLLAADQVLTRLFGHRPPGSNGLAEPGLLRETDGGTLFLEEIGRLPGDAQVQLMDFLETGGRIPGNSGTGASVSDVRLIASTSQDLEQLVEAGSFRRDLFLRLNVIPLRLQPLRARMEDVADLVRHFVKLHELEGGDAKQFDEAAMNALKRYDWPGNVLELELFVKRLCLISPYEKITAKLVEAELTPNPDKSRTMGDADRTGSDSLENAVEFAALQILESAGRDALPENLYDRLLPHFERPVLVAALRTANGNQLKASAILGLNRNTLRKKIREHGIQIVKTTG